jgi:hypothetical protein
VRRATLLRATAIAMAGALAVAACGGDDGDDAATTTTAAGTTTTAGGGELAFTSEEETEDILFEGELGAFAKENYTTDLVAAGCPNPLIVQKDWLNEAEHGGLYQLIGGGGTATKNNYRGPLGSTGIDLEILDGGPGLDPTFAVNTVASLYQGNPVQGKTPHLAYVTTDDAIIFSKLFPAINVVSPMRINPQMLFFDPATYPSITNLDGVKAAVEEGAQIYVTTKAGSYVKYMIGQGVPESAFVEGYGGDLDKFVTSGGTWLNQGFVSNETYTIERLVPEWGKPVRAVLIADLGFDIYPQALSIAANRKDELDGCLKAVVPLIQQAQIDYMENPVEINNMIADYNDKGLGADFWKTPLKLNQSAVKIMREFKLISNDPSTGALGGIDPAKVGKAVDIMKVILEADSAATNWNPDIVAEDVFTNEYIDTSIAWDQ